MAGKTSDAALGPSNPLGWTATDFDLEGTDAKRHRLSDVRGPNGLLVMFICNHCPYVLGTIADIVADAALLKEEGIGAIAIMPNDTDSYPADSFPNMIEFATAHRLGFPYAIDKTQDVARAYGAVCTPDFFGFDKALGLRYRGRLCETSGARPKPGARRELLEAMRAVARTGMAPAGQAPAIGCSIKWRD
jgi:peroxiredoxin